MAAMPAVRAILWMMTLADISFRRFRRGIRRPKKVGCAVGVRTHVVSELLFAGVRQRFENAFGQLRLDTTGSEAAARQEHRAALESDALAQDIRN